MKSIRGKYWVMVSIIGMICVQGFTQVWPVDSIYPRLQWLRISFHIFQDEGGGNNFSAEIDEDIEFLNELENWVNYRLGHLEKLEPAQISAFVPDTRVRIRLDTIYFHADQYAWDCSEETDGYYMRSVYVDSDSLITFQQKYQTLPVFFGGNHSVAGGFASNLGSKNFIAIRGYYTVYQKKNRIEAIEECGRNLLHELCHCMGLGHNFQEGLHGDQCDHCEDNGCPEEGTSNNIMDYWPDYGYALSVCQLEFIHEHLAGSRGDISEVLINDSCYVESGRVWALKEGEVLVVTDTLYSHGDVYLHSGSRLVVEGYLSMPMNGEIRMEPGSDLTVSGGNIGNLCGELWKGISLMNDSLIPGSEPVTLKFSSATIEHARQAVALVGSVNMDCHDSQFLNNVNGISSILSEKDSLSISGSKFATTNRLNMYDLGITPGTFLHVDGPGKLNLVDCVLINEPGTFFFSSDYLGTGIMARSNDVKIEACRFENLTRGLVSYPSLEGSMLLVRDSWFVHNQMGVFSGFGGFQSIRQSQFILQKLDRRVATGILLLEPQKFEICENDFFSEYGSGEQIGVVLDQPSTETCMIEGNRVTRLPIGFLVNNTQQLDSLLMDYFLGGEEAKPTLPFGPLFIDNEFFETDSWLSFQDQFGYGISIGNHVNHQTRMTDPAGWPSGGFSWYNESHTQCGFFGLNVDLPEPVDGIWFYTNVLGIDKALSEVRETESQSILAEVTQYIGEYNTFLNSECKSGMSDPYEWLMTLSTNPMAARSSKTIDCWKESGFSIERWVEEQGGFLTTKYSRQDTLLTRYAAFIGRKNQAEWKSVYPVIAGSTELDRIRWDSLQTHRPQSFFPSYFIFQQPNEVKSSAPDFTIYPVPASDWLHIRPKAGVTIGKGWYYRVVALQGSSILADIILDWEDLTFSIQGLADGIYNVEIWQKERFLGSQRMVKIRNNPK